MYVLYTPNLYMRFIHTHTIHLHILALMYTNTHEHIFRRLLLCMLFICCRPKSRHRNRHARFACLCEPSNAHTQMCVFSASVVLFRLHVQNHRAQNLGESRTHRAHCTNTCKHTDTHTHTHRVSTYNMRGQLGRAKQPGHHQATRRAHTGSHTRSTLTRTL